MAVRVGAHEVKTRLSEYLNRIACGRERIVVERHGKPVAALVSLEDLQRLEALDEQGVDDDTRLPRALREVGAVVQWPTGPAVLASERRPLRLQGQLLSEQIVAERR